MAKPPPRPALNFQRNLARTIALTDGRQLKSLHDARELMIVVSGSVNARPGALDQVIRLLITAAETGKRDDIAAATDAIERVLRDGRLL
jgi:hypothetical protein